MLTSEIHSLVPEQMGYISSRHGLLPLELHLRSILEVMQALLGPINTSAKSALGLGCVITR